MRKYYTLNGDRVKYNIISMLGLYLHFVGMGEEGVVFKEHDRVVKFYHPMPQKPVLDLETAKVLTNIKTSRILLPDDKDDSLLLNESGHLVGYKSKYVKNLGVKKLLSLDIKKFKKESMLLKRDVSVLSDYHISIDDLQFQNFIFNNGMYFIDVGSFELSQEEVSEIYKTNMTMLDEGLLEIMYYVDTCLEQDIWNSIIKISKIYSYYLESDYVDVVDFINYEIKEENLAKYLVKRK